MIIKKVFVTNKAYQKVFTRFVYDRSQTIKSCTSVRYMYSICLKRDASIRRVLNK